MGTGALTTGSAGTLTLTGAKPSAAAFLFTSLAATPTPFKGGTLVPLPVLLGLPLGTSPGGQVALAWSSWPAGLSGLPVHLQYAIQDAGAVAGVALSNAARGDVP